MFPRLWAVTNWLLEVFFFRELLSHMKNNMTAIKVFLSMEVNFLLVWEPAIFFFNYQFVLFYLELLSTVHVKV